MLERMAIEREMAAVEDQEKRRKNELHQARLKEISELQKRAKEEEDEKKRQQDMIRQQRLAARGGEGPETQTQPKSTKNKLETNSQKEKKRGRPFKNVSEVDDSGSIRMSGRIVTKDGTLVLEGFWRVERKESLSQKKESQGEESFPFR